MYFWWVKFGDAAKNAPKLKIQPLLRVVTNKKIKDKQARLFKKKKKKERKYYGCVKRRKEIDLTSNIYSLHTEWKY